MLGPAEFMVASSTGSLGDLISLCRLRSVALSQSSIHDRTCSGCHQTCSTTTVTALADLKNPNLIIVKGALFLVLGLIASGLLILQAARIDLAILLAIAIWAFCRFYYFAFYVIEHYVDDGYKFDGLYSAIKYLSRRYSNRNNDG